jgi:hypothetical protein
MGMPHAPLAIDQDDSTLALASLTQDRHREACRILRMTVPGQEIEGGLG